MSSFFIYIISFIFGLSFLVAFHEFGHFWVARKLGVKVLTFSIGFGKPAWCFHTDKDGTKYQFAAWPFGGYVNFLDERNGDVRADIVHRAFNRQTLWKRAAIVAAGPIANFLLAIILLSCVYMIGVKGIIPVVNTPIEGSIADEAGIKKGMRIQSIAGTTVERYQSAMLEILGQGIKGGQTTIEVIAEGTNTPQSLTLDFRGDNRLLKDPDFDTKLGLRPNIPSYPAKIVEVVDGGAAAQAGIQAGDVLLALDGIAITDVASASQYIRTRPGQAINLTFEREGIEKEVVVNTSSEVVNKNEAPIGLFGVMFAGLPQELLDKITYTEKYGLSAAFSQSINRTYNLSVTTLQFLGNLLTGKASIRNLSGPVGIAESAGNSASAGISPYLFFLAFLSINLAVLNLLPLPVLDGGHLFFYLIEWVKGSPVTERIQEMSFRVGFFALISMMLIASYMDITRIFG